jgi:hypothetical protein
VRFIFFLIDFLFSLAFLFSFLALSCNSLYFFLAFSIASFCFSISASSSGILSSLFQYFSSSNLSILSALSKSQFILS